MFVFHTKSRFPIQQWPSKPGVCVCVYGLVIQHDREVTGPEQLVQTSTPGQSPRVAATAHGAWGLGHCDVGDFSS